MSTSAADRALQMIEQCVDPKSLRQIAVNARRQGMSDVARAADLRLYEILPSEKPGTLEHDVWRSIHALEGTLSSERGKTTRLGRTRPKIARVGECETVKDLILRKEPSEGFHMLLERQMAELTFEAVALRHPDRFDREVLDAAEQRLQEAGIILSEPSGLAR
ncbi:hypothetical protein [Sinorhizobium meliloti]|uniref:hypothetical protein n=1 Tax=Rhizobium meliloti TaxID=382 RepID=UPI001295AE0C|nr:hypothetical protein [Sinorhizobium meliloti]MDX0525154.1 hypothetical protein [Sinorhizobium medicae]MDW9439229.1 hypothetical protein [Sinorhizobium meliloti]MDW9484052.1 hypothetical protein [Sinorhizobium meliloti]MDX0636674.1 hypothetical protein [Sinorhizobium medicae]MQV61368.1 hypothetical protein [Sinorhizobium meliloti]